MEACIAASQAAEKTTVMLLNAFVEPLYLQQGSSFSDALRHSNE